MGKKTFLVIFGVLIFGQTAQADRVMPTPHVTSTFPDEIRLSSATMEMYGALNRIVEQREKGNSSPDDLGKYTSAFDQLAQVRENIICRDSVNPTACHTQNVAQKDQLLNEAASLKALNPGDYRKNKDLWATSFAGYKHVIQKRIDNWSAAYDKAVQQSKIANGSTHAAAEAIGVEYDDKENKAHLTGLPAEDRAPATVETATLATPTGTASGAL